MSRRNFMKWLPLFPEVGFLHHSGAMHCRVTLNRTMRFAHISSEGHDTSEKIIVKSHLVPCGVLLQYLQVLGDDLASHGVGSLHSLLGSMRVGHINLFPSRS